MRRCVLLGVPGDPADPETFSGHRFVGLSLLPWRWVRDLPERRHELVRAVWRPAEAAGELEVVSFDGYFRDTGTLAGYLAANLHAAGDGNLIAPGATVTGRCDRAVVGDGAVVEGAVTRSVVWPDAGCRPMSSCGRGPGRRGRHRAGRPVVRGPRRSVQQAPAVALGDGRGAVAHAELGVDVQQVGLDGGLADEQAGGRLPVGGAVGDQVAAPRARAG